MCLFVSYVSPLKHVLTFFFQFFQTLPSFCFQTLLLQTFAFKHFLLSMFIALLLQYQCSPSLIHFSSLEELRSLHHLDL